MKTSDLNGRWCRLKYTCACNKLNNLTCVKTASANIIKWRLKQFPTCLSYRCWCCWIGNWNGTFKFISTFQNIYLPIAKYWMLQKQSYYNLMFGKIHQSLLFSGRERDSNLHLFKTRLSNVLRICNIKSQLLCSVSQQIDRG